MLIVKKAISFALKVLIVLVVILLMATVVYYLSAVRFTVLLLILGLITLLIAYLEFSKNQSGIQMPIFLGRSPANTNTTAVLNTNVLGEERDVNDALLNQSVHSKGKILSLLISHTALEYGVAGIITVVFALSLYLASSIDYRMMEAIGDNTGFGIEELPWNMTINRFYNETGYTEQDSILLEDGLKEVKRDDLYPLFFDDVHFDLVSRFKDNKLVEIGYILISTKPEVILSVMDKLNKSFKNTLPEPVDGSLDEYLILPKKFGDYSSISWLALDGSRLNISIRFMRPNYVLEVISKAPEKDE